MQVGLFIEAIRENGMQVKSSQTGVVFMKIKPGPRGAVVCLVWTRPEFQ